MSNTVETVEVEITFEELFGLFGHQFVADSTLDIRGYDVEVMTDKGFVKVNALYSTPEYETYCLKTKNSNGNIEFLNCADKHLLSLSSGEWTPAANLKVGDRINSMLGFVSVESVELLTNQPEVMCDIEVEGLHRFYANGLLSHNSHLLVNFGASALLAGKNVLHYTFELNERATGIRYDSNLMDIDSIDCFDNKEKIKQFYANNVETLGRLKIKYYSTGEASVSTLRSHIDKLAIEGFRPDLIIIDYAGIMRSTDRMELLRLELKKVFEELRGFANEMDCPIWTAVQSNKDGANKDFIDVTNMAEAYGQAHVADFIVGLARKSLAKSTGYGNVFIAKNRAGIDGIQLQIHLDTARSKLRVISESEFQASKANQENDEESGLTGQFRQKVREFQKNHS